MSNSQKRFCFGCQKYFVTVRGSYYWKRHLCKSCVSNEHDRRKSIVTKPVVVRDGAWRGTGV